MFKNSLIIMFINNNYVKNEFKVNFLKKYETQDIIKN